MQDHLRNDGPGMRVGSGGQGNKPEHKGPGGGKGLGGPGGPKGSIDGKKISGIKDDKRPVPPPPPAKDSEDTSSTSTSATTATGILSGLAGLGVGAAAGSIITSLIKDKKDDGENDVTEENTEPTNAIRADYITPAKCPYCGGNVDAGMTACPYCDSRLV